MVPWLGAKGEATTGEMIIGGFNRSKASSEDD